MRNNGANPPVKGSDCWDRRAVAKFCRCSVGSIRYMEKQGLLRHSFRDANGVYWYDPQKVRDANIKRRAARSNESRRAGALHASVFGKLRDGMRVRDIVIELAEPVEVIEDLAKKWQEDNEAIVPAAVVEQLEQLMQEAGYKLVWSDMPGHLTHWLRIEREHAARIVESSVRAVKASGRPKTLRAARPSARGNGPRKAQAQ